MKGLFIPEITAEMFRNGCLESIEALMAEGEICDIDYEPEPRWIPVTERLPDDDSACFVTVKYRDIRYTDIAHCFASKDSSVRDWVGANDDDVLAWMPMPEPWKGENDAEID